MRVSTPQMTLYVRGVLYYPSTESYMSTYRNIGAVHALQSLGVVKTANPNRLDANAHKEILNKIRDAKSSGAKGGKNTRQLVNQIVDGIKNNPALAVGAAVGTVFGLAALDKNESGYPEMEPYHESPPPLQYKPMY